jgi:hypothetical protein
MKAEPQEEHRWLEQLVGDWVMEAEMDMGPDHPPETSKGTERVRSIGGLWFMAEGRGEVPGGGEATMIMILGYDPAKKRYVGSWIGSMMAYQWVYEGELDAAGRVLTLESEGPDMAGGGGTARYRDLIELRSSDHRVLTSHMLDGDGDWHPFMEAHFRRRT